MIYIVNVSGGLTSYEALRRCVARHGVAATRAVFADTLIEDPDLYRFLDDIERHLAITITRLVDGRTPFDVWHSERAMTLPNGAVPCSNILKREQINRWLATQAAPYTLVFGMDWNEKHRMDRLVQRYAPTPLWFPLLEKPYLDKCHIADQLKRDGIAVPRLYDAGFVHNNCGGACVKAGKAQFAHLLRTYPETYARWEMEESRFRAAVNENVTILEDRRGGGPRRPVTLAAFRGWVERGEAYDEAEWGGCGCFSSGAIQDRMDDLLMEVRPRHADDEKD